MIRYPLTREELESLIDQANSTWLQRARDKTKAFRRLRDYSEPSASWSDIKEVFLKLQNDKCAYCERQLGEKSYGKKEHDIEHYRPKNAVKVWPTDRIREERKLNYAFQTGKKTAKGYYLLAYNPLNYATACSSCNSSLKSSFFPIAGKKRVTATDDFEKLRTEEPFLLFPVGELDNDNPEDLLTFIGTTPVPKAQEQDGARYWRARMTIDFFDLAVRDDLVRERSRIIIAIWTAFRLMQIPGSTPDDVADAQRLIIAATSPSSPHTNCARAFYSLCQTDINTARDCKDRAQAIAGNK